MLFLTQKYVSCCRTEGLQEVKDKVKSFDWTYTTDYKGTLAGATPGVSSQGSLHLRDPNKQSLEGKCLLTLVLVVLHSLECSQLPNYL